MSIACRILPLFTALALVSCGSGGSGSATSPTIPPPPVTAGSGGVNDVDKRDSPYVVLVSIDGFRWDYTDLYATPNIDRLVASGVRAESLRPVFPTLTFPNHYSIATGLNPSNHGIVANAFPSRDRQRWYRLSDPASVGDGSWYGGEPVWAAAEANGLVSAAFFFVGTEAEIGGIRPTYWREFEASIPGGERVDQVLQWLDMPDDARPHMITLYFGSVDSTGHLYGPNAPQTAADVAQVDQHIGELLDGIDQSPVADEVYVILVSDHGMSTQLPGTADFVLSDFIDLSGISVVGSGPYAFMFFDQEDASRAERVRDTINASWANGSAWTRDEAPAEWSVTAESRFPDVIVQADDGYRVAETIGRLAEFPVGMHGWAPGFVDMDGIFVASGPRLPAGATVATASVLDVYPLMLAILEIPLTLPIDGDTEALAGLLEADGR